jgi:hypothetical protein
MQFSFAIKTMSCRTESRKTFLLSQRWACGLSHRAAALRFKKAYIAFTGWPRWFSKGRLRRKAVMLEFLKEKDVASMSGRLLRRWGKEMKPQLLSRS